MPDKCRLYLITPPEMDLVPFADSLAAALDGGDVACLQLRLKGAQDGAIRAAIAELMPVCHAREVAFIVNDRPDLAAECGADGAHIGADDVGFPARCRTKTRPRECHSPVALTQPTPAVLAAFSHW